MNGIAFFFFVLGIIFALFGGISMIVTEKDSTKIVFFIESCAFTLSGILAYLLGVQ